MYLATGQSSYDIQQNVCEVNLLFAQFFIQLQNFSTNHGLMDQQYT